MVVVGTKQMVPFHVAIVDKWIGDISGESVIVIWVLYVVYLPFGGVASGGSG